MDGWVSELWEGMHEEQQAELPQLGTQQPWIYNSERKAILQAEFDAIFAHLYGPNTEDLRHNPRSRRYLWQRLHQRDLPCAKRQRDTPVR